jgi:hypothetical protein
VAERSEASEVMVTYRGPTAGAVPCARALAEADGVELIGSQRNPTGSDDLAEMIVTLEGSPADIEAAVVEVSRGLPPGATLSAT